MKTLVDRFGVPLIVQDFRFKYGNFSFEATVFTGEKFWFDAGNLVSDLDLCAQQPSRMQFLQALNSATKFLEENWIDLPRTA